MHDRVRGILLSIGVLEKKKREGSAIVTENFQKKKKRGVALMSMLLAS